MHVLVKLYGGPANPNGGGSALNGSPAANARVTVIDDQRDAVSTSADTRGVATFDLVPGRYRYRSGTCGAGVGRHRPVTVAAGHIASVQITCAIP